MVTRTCPAAVVPCQWLPGYFNCNTQPCEGGKATTSSGTFVAAWPEIRRAAYFTARHILVTGDLLRFDLEFRLPVEACAGRHASNIPTMGEQALRIAHSVPQLQAKLLTTEVNLYPALGGGWERDAAPPRL